MKRGHPTRRPAVLLYRFQERSTRIHIAHPCLGVVTLPNALPHGLGHEEEHENAEFLLRAYSELQIAYLKEEPRKDGGEPRLYSALIDGDSEFNT